VAGGCDVVVEESSGGGGDDVAWLAATSAPRGLGHDAAVDENGGKCGDVMWQSTRDVASTRDMAVDERRGIDERCGSQRETWQSTRAVASGCDVAVEESSGGGDDMAWLAAMSTPRLAHMGAHERRRRRGEEVWWW